MRGRTNILGCEIIDNAFLLGVHARGCDHLAELLHWHPFDQEFTIDFLQGKAIWGAGE